MSRWGYLAIGILILLVGMAGGRLPEVGDYVQLKTHADYTYEGYIKNVTSNFYCIDAVGEWSASTAWDQRYYTAWGFDATWDVCLSINSIKQIIWPDEAKASSPSHIADTPESHVVYTVSEPEE